MRAETLFADIVDPQRGHLFPWLPVCLGLGIGAYFSQDHEPGLLFCVGVATGGLVACLAALRAQAIAPLLWAIALLCAGFALAGARTHRVAAPVLEFRYYGPIEGRIVAIDRSASDKVRLTLDRVVLARMDPTRTPKRVRVSLHGTQGFFTPEPGQTLILTGHLSAPSGPAEPGGFDFQRHAWFQGMGAVGYTRTPVLLLEAADAGQTDLFVLRARMAISGYVRAELPGRIGAFAAAITTGDRSAMDLATLKALRASNLAHLLAISGLHMGLLTGFVFAALRLAIALVPYAALRLPARKIAALGALAAGAVYLALSGGNVATERAFIMAAVILMAVFLDRRAMTLRAVAVAATIVLILRPEAMMGPGFQMSFAATTALVATFGAMRDVQALRHLPKWTRPVLGLFVSSFVAGAATAPIAAAHFNQIPHYGLIANLVSVPLMGVLVMPAAVLAALLAPLGLAWIGLRLMAPGIGWILAVAEHVAALPGALSLVVAPQHVVLPLICLGALWVVIWQGRARALGVVPVLAGFFIWTGAERPPLLISDSAGLVGLMTDEGRALSKPKGDGFAAAFWLENDGDPAAQPDAHRRAGLDQSAGQAVFVLGGQTIAHITGRGAANRVARACAQGYLVVVSVAAEAPAGCIVIDQRKLRAEGAMAGRLDDGRLVFQSAHEVAGTRLWNSPTLRREKWPRRAAQ